MRNPLIFATRILPWLALALMAGFFPLVPGVQRFDLHLMDAQARWSRRLHPRPAPLPEVVVVGIREATLEALPEPLSLFHRPLGRFLEAMAQARPRAVGVDAVLPERSVESLLPGADFDLLRGMLALRSQGVPLVLGRGVQADGRLQAVYPPMATLAGESGMGLLLTPLDPDGIARRFRPSLGADGRGPTFAALLAKACGRPSPEGYVDFSLGRPFETIPLERVLDWQASGRTDQLAELFQGRIVLLGSVLPFEDILRLPVALDAQAPPDRREAPGVILHAQTLRTLLAGTGIRPLPAGVQSGLALAGALAGLALARRRGGGAGLLALLGGTLAAFLLGMGRGVFIPPFACAGPAALVWLTLQAGGRLQDLRARREAEATLQAQAAFLARMSHEIRTPLNAVLGLAHLGQRQESPSAMATALARIEEAGRGLMEVLNQILDFSRLGSGALELERIPFEPFRLLERLEDLFGAQATLQGLGFHLRLDPAVPPVLLGDPLRLGQVMTNLVANALKFTEQGRVEVRILRAGGPPDLPCLRFEVQDTGIGLGPGERARLFQPFTQADPSTSRRFGGNGLGLSIASRLVAAMGGVLEVASEPGQGSTFHFQACFPLGPEALGSLRNRKVLLVEDHPINQEVARELLREAGALVSVASTGPEGVRSALEERPALVLMDLQLPGMDGLQAARNILAGCPELPILAMTAEASPAAQQACLEAGMRGVILKPLDPQTFLEAIRPWMPSAQPGAPETPAAQTPASHLPRPQEDPEPAGLELEAALQRLGGNRALLRQLLARFPEFHGEDALRLREHLAQGDLKGAKGLLHRLRGAAATLSATPLAEACLDLEAALDSGGPGAVAQARLEGTLAALLERCLQGERRLEVRAPGNREGKP